MVALNSIGDLTLEYISPISNIDYIVVTGLISLLECGRSVNSKVGSCSDKTSNLLLSSTSTCPVWDTITVNAEVPKFSS